MTLHHRKPDKVYFFGTCLIDLMYPNAGMAGIQLLQREGIKVLFPQNQTCCGQPAFNSGFREEAKGVVLKQMELFTHYFPIVVPSGSCAGMMKHHYPELFKGDEREAEVKHFTDRVFELTEFLVDYCDIKLEDLGEPIDIAVHTSCSARREMGVADKIESLLGQLDNVTLKEQSHKKECCGFGGTFSVKQPEISAAMVEDKTNAICDTGVNTFITQDCGCMMNITGHAEYAKKDLQGQHIAEFLWERTNANGTR